MKTLILWLSLVGASQGWAISAEEFEFRKDQQAIVNLDLFAIRKSEVASMSVHQVAQKNALAIQQLNAMSWNGHRAFGITKAEAEKLVASIAHHPVVGRNNIYEKQKVSIGFCFGRATYTHLMLLKMGVDKDSIRKAFVVGNMNNGVSWAWHVTTVVRSADGKGWWAVDNFTGVTFLEDWFAQVFRLSTDKKLRIYISEPAKFSAELAKYSPGQLGLKMQKKNDWYSGYFADLTKWFKATPDIRSMGLDYLAETTAPEELKPLL